MIGYVSLGSESEDEPLNEMIVSSGLSPLFELDCDTALICRADAADLTHRGTSTLDATSKEGSRPGWLVIC